jgi:biotin operon repressor|tara:strand:- start:642 stop:815 length:174 start_codon:yes stop_codon:yes gene_type:complete
MKLQKGGSRLSMSKAAEIRTKYLDKTNKVNQHELAKEYGCSRQAISKIITNQTWTIA